MISSDEIWDWYEQDRVQNLFETEDALGLRSLSLHNRTVGELEMLKEQQALYKKWYNHHNINIKSGDLDKAFDLNNPSCVLYSCYDDHYKYEESVQSMKLFERELEWHHIVPLEEDIALMQANNIDSLLRGKDR